MNKNKKKLLKKIIKLKMEAVKCFQYDIASSLRLIEREIDQEMLSEEIKISQLHKKIDKDH